MYLTPSNLINIKHIILTFNKKRTNIMNKKIEDNLEKEIIQEQIENLKARTRKINAEAALLEKDIEDRNLENID